MNNKIKNRFNLFNRIHKGMRAMLYSSGMSLQLNDFRDLEETLSVFEKINEVISIANDHAIKENKYILPLIAKFDEAVVKELETEHLKYESMAYRLKSLMALYHHAICEEEMMETGDAIFKGFNVLIAFSVYHMNKEDDILNKMLWQHYSDKEIYGIYEAIISSIPADKISVQGRWIMRGINNNEIIQWLLSYHGLHPAAFQFLLQLAEDELPETRWSRIKEALCEGEMLQC